MPTGLRDVISVQGVTFPAYFEPPPAKAFYDVLAIQGLTFPTANVSSMATAGFEEKDARDTMYVTLTTVTFGDTKAYVSLALQQGTRDVTAAQAKRLPGVNAAENITVYCELFADSLEGGRNAALEIMFFDESGNAQGEVQTIPVTEALSWQQKKAVITVPANATRVNAYLRCGCTTDETVKAWCAHLRIAR